MSTDVDTMKAGRTVPPHFEFYEYPVMKFVTALDNYQEQYDTFIADNEKYTAYFLDVLVRDHYKPGDTVLILVKRVRHAKAVIQKLLKYNLYAEEYSGAVHRDARLDLKSEYQNGEVPILVATEQTFSVGQDVPRITTLLNLGGGLSADREKQKIGRGLRSFEDKEYVTIIQPYITGHKWLARHSAQRLALARRYKTGKVTIHPYQARPGLDLI